jgi:peptide/nickel transport system ATP-binding protein/oligopeptide transport system ATP-binding protein
LIVEPAVLICDEPISALDVSIQAQVINLLDQLRRSRGITLLFISHDLSVVRHLCDHVAVMYMGSIVEAAPTDLLFENPLHPYTAALIASIPIPEPGEQMDSPPLMGEPPSVLDPPPGCRFHPRCPIAVDVCKTVKPDLTEVETNRLVACHVVSRGAAQ